MPTFPAGQSDELDIYADQDVPLNSEVIDTANYNKQTQSLNITFVSGRDYTFSDVPPDIFLGLVQASSPGRYFNDHIKGKYA
jgi:hypothetical protein